MVSLIDRWAMMKCRSIMAAGYDSVGLRYSEKRVDGIDRPVPQWEVDGYSNMGPTLLAIAPTITKALKQATRAATPS